MKKKMLKTTAVLLIAVFVFGFAACGSNNSEVASEDNTGGSDFSTRESASMSEPAAAEAPATAEDSADMDVSEDSTGSAGVGSVQPATNRKITFSASYSLNTKSYDKDYARINQLVKDAGGYIANEETSAYTYEFEGTEGRSSYFTLKIPVKGYDSFLEKLQMVGEVANKNKSSEDLTSEYFDTESRINMLEMRRDRLTEYIRTATKAADIVEFEKELSDVLLELDQYEGNKRRLDQLVDYATVNVSLSELITPETIGKDGQPLVDRASDAFRMSATGVGEFLRNVAVFFAGAAPVIALIVVILVIVWLIVRAVRRARARYRDTRPEKKKERRKVYARYAPQPQPEQAPQQGQPQDSDSKEEQPENRNSGR
jgi:hypothetical protein